MSKMRGTKTEFEFLTLRCTTDAWECALYIRVIYVLHIKQYLESCLEHLYRTLITMKKNSRHLSVHIVYMQVARL